jgi:hypothetical protein
VNVYAVQLRLDNPTLTNRPRAESQVAVVLARDVDQARILVHKQTKDILWFDPRVSSVDRLGSSECVVARVVCLGR